MELPPILAIIGSYFAMAAGVWALFDRADKAIKEETKIAVSLWLISSNPSAGNSKWPGQFINIFDSVFGEKHLSWKRFLRSSVASFVAINILILVYIAKSGADKWTPWGSQNSWGPLFGVYILGALVNFLPDYVSLAETRIVLKWMSRSKTFLIKIGLLCLDLVVSGLLFIGGLILVFYLINSGWSPSNSISEANKFIIVGLSFSGEYGVFGVFIYSTFFTSVWIWLYVLSGMTIKIYNRTGRSFKLLTRFLDFENKPLPALGFVSNLIILFIYLVGFGFFYHGSYL